MDAKESRFNQVWRNPGCCVAGFSSGGFMAAVTDQFLASNIHTAEVTLANRGFIRTTPKRVTPSQWMNGAHHWATIEVMPSGKAVVKIGVSTL